VFWFGSIIKLKEHSMRKLAIAAAMASIVVSGGASAQNGSGTPQAGGQNQMHQMNQNGQSVRQTLQKHLQDAGFSDVQMIPTSFLIRAKDNQGQPVSMVVTPDSVMTITEITDGQTNAQNPTGTTGSAAGSPAGSQSR
jgi:hypothetical protein